MVLKVTIETSHEWSADACCALIQTPDFVSNFHASIVFTGKISSIEYSLPNFWKIPFSNVSFLNLLPAYERAY